MNDETLGAGSDEELPANEEVGAGESASDETTDESTVEAQPTGKEKALKDTESALKERKAEFTRLSQQFAEMKGQMDLLKQLQVQQRAQPKEETKDWLDTIDNEKFMEDPATATKNMFAMLRKEMASVLTDRDKFLLEQSKSISRLDPAIQTAVDELRNDPELADLPDAKLIAMAKKMGVTKKAVMSPRGNIAGGQRGVPAKTSVNPEENPEFMAYLRAVGAIPSNKRTDTLE
jgi:hypothetical protein